MITSFGVCISLYFFNKILYKCLYEFTKNNFFCRTLYEINLFVEIIIIAMFLYCFRSREWPDYFGLDVETLNLERGNRERI